MTGTRAAIRWAEIVDACAVRGIAMNQTTEQEDLQVWLEELMIKSFNLNIKTINL